MKKRKFNLSIAIGLLSITTLPTLLMVSCANTPSSQNDINLDINGNKINTLNELVDYLSQHSDETILSSDEKIEFSIRINGVDKYFDSVSDLVVELDKYITVKEVYLDSEAEFNEETTEISNHNNSLISKDEPIFTLFKKSDGSFTFAPKDNVIEVNKKRDEAIQTYLHVHNAYYFNGIYFSNKGDVFAYIMSKVNDDKINGMFEGDGSHKVYNLILENGDSRVFSEKDPNLNAKIEEFVQWNAVPHYITKVSVDSRGNKIYDTTTLSESNIDRVADEFEKNIDVTTSDFIKIESNNDQVTQIVDIADDNERGNLFGPYFIESGTGIGNISNPSAWTTTTSVEIENNYSEMMYIDYITEDIASRLTIPIINSSSFENPFNKYIPNCDITILNLLSFFETEDRISFFEKLESISLPNNKTLAYEYSMFINNLYNGQRATLFNTITASYSWLIDKMLKNNIDSHKIKNVISHFVLMQEKFDLEAIRIVAPLISEFDFGDASKVNYLRLFSNSWQFENMSFQRNFDSYKRRFIGADDAVENRFMYEMVKYMVMTTTSIVSVMMKNLTNFDDLVNKILSRQYTSIPYILIEWNKSVNVLERMSINSKEIANLVNGFRYFNTHGYSNVFTEEQIVKNIESWLLIENEKIDSYNQNIADIENEFMSAKKYSELEAYVKNDLDKNLNAAYIQTTSLESIVSEGIMNEDYLSIYVLNVSSIDQFIGEYNNNNLFKEFTDTTVKLKESIGNVKKTFDELYEVIKEDKIVKETVAWLNESKLKIKQQFTALMGPGRLLDSPQSKFSQQFSKIYDKSKALFSANGSITKVLKALKFAGAVAMTISIAIDIIQSFSKETHTVYKYKNGANVLYWDGGYEKKTWWGLKSAKKVTINDLKLIEVEDVISGYAQSGFYYGNETHESVRPLAISLARNLIQNTLSDKRNLMQNGNVDDKVIWKMRLIDNSGSIFEYVDETARGMAQQIKENLDPISEKIFYQQDGKLTTNEGMASLDKINTFINGLKPVYILQKPETKDGVISQMNNFVLPKPFYASGVIVDLPNDNNGQHIINEMKYTIFNPNLNIDVPIEGMTDEYKNSLIDKIINKSDADIAGELVKSVSSEKYVVPTKDVFFQELNKNHFVPLSESFDSVKPVGELVVLKSFINFQGKQKYFHDKENLLKEMMKEENYDFKIHMRAKNIVVYIFDSIEFRNMDEMIKYAIEKYTIGDDDEK